MSKMNRLGNALNPFQGDRKRVLCVCSAGLLRSPTAMKILLNEPFNFNARAVGIAQEYALIPVEDVHVHWADEIVVMSGEQKDYLLRKFNKFAKDTLIHVLDVPDNYGTFDPKLEAILTEKLKEIFLPAE